MLFDDSNLSEEGRTVLQTWLENQGESQSVLNKELSLTFTIIWIFSLMFIWLGVFIRIVLCS